MQVNNLALIVVGVVLLALFVLAGYAIDRLATTAPKKIFSVLIALTCLVGAVPAVISAFDLFAA